MTGIGRRDFLSGSGALLAAAATPAFGPGTRSATPRNPSSEADWAAVREQFALDPAIAHFAAFVLASPPKTVRDAIDRHRQALDFDTASYIEQDIDDPPRRAAAHYLAARPSEVALTTSTTVGLGLVYGGFDLRAGDTVLTTDHDFYSTHEALRRAARRSGATIERIALYDDPSAADADEIVDRIAAALTPATRIVAVTWVHSGTGVKIPISAIAAAVADHNARSGADVPTLLCVDGLHGFGVEDETVISLGCDVFVSGTHKWLWGPRGTGIVWATESAWESISAEAPPFEQVHFDAWIDDVEPLRPPGGPANTPGGYIDFEHRMALPEAFAFHQLIGKPAVAERTRSQATQLKAALAGVAGVRVVTPMSESLSSGIVCVELADVPVFALVEPLRDAGFATSITPYREQYLRIGPSIITTPAQVDGLVDAITSLTRA